MLESRFFRVRSARLRFVRLFDFRKQTKAPEAESGAPTASHPPAKTK
jgi:hypothetical protein